MTTFDRLGHGQIAIEHDQSGSTVKAPYILKTDENGIMWRPGTAPMLSPQQRVDAFTTEHIPPEIEIPLGFQNWVGGAGFEEISSSDLNALAVYNFSRGVDLSWGERVYMSPELALGSVVEATRPKKVVWSEELGLFAINDQFVYEWTGSAWTERYDSGSTVTINDLVEYANSTDTYLVAGRVDAQIVTSVDGVNWISPEAVKAVPAHRNSQTATDTAATSITITKPVAAAEDDILVAHIAIDVSGESIAAPLGWNLVHHESIAGGVHAVFWRRVGDSDGANYAFSWSSAADVAGGMSAYDGARTVGSPIDNATVKTDNSGTDHVASAADAKNDNRMLITLFSAFPQGAATWTEPAGSTERYDAGDANNAVRIEGNEESVDVGGTGDQTATLSTSATGIATLLLLAAEEFDGAWNVSRFGIRGSLTGEPLLWALDTFGDIRNTTDPTTPSTWTAADETQVGQDENTVAGMVVVDNTFYVFRDTEIVSYDGLTVSTVYSSPTLKLATDAARPSLWVDGNIYFTYNHQLLQFNAPNNVITPIWPASLGNAELNGTITAIAGDENHLYFAVKNVAGNTYIMKGDPRLSLTVGVGLIRPFHTWSFAGTGDALAMLVVPADSDAMDSTGPQLVLGSDASLNYHILPRAGFRPEDDSNYRFVATANQFVNGAFVDWGARAFPKFLNRGAIIADDIDEDDTIALQYQLPGGTATTIVTANAAATADRYEAVLTAEVEFTTLRYKGIFNNGAATTTPILEGFALHATLNPPRKRIWTFTVDLPPKGNDQDGRFLASHLFNALNERSTLYDMEGNSFLVRILDIQGIGATLENEGLHQALTVVAVQI